MSLLDIAFCEVGGKMWTGGFKEDEGRGRDDDGIIRTGTVSLDRDDEESGKVGWYRDYVCKSKKNGKNSQIWWRT